MAGLCEGGNEPPGSLKAKNEWNTGMFMRRWHNLTLLRRFSRMLLSLKKAAKQHNEVCCDKNPTTAYR
ncbi:hypothetical protein ANN_11206 [Periplaneta americana]|uniref:Uncharacterized protein n=1 Tax=Periplaneta americana TaxID=6978 RepID=A0ABQ8T5J9_PERAM|nr:hypothetical protein ANN_11206 [Periplaneta americana]